MLCGSAPGWIPTEGAGWLGRGILAIVAIECWSAHVDTRSLPLWWWHHRTHRQQRILCCLHLCCTVGTYKGTAHHCTAAPLHAHVECTCPHAYGCASASRHPTYAHSTAAPLRVRIHARVARHTVAYTAALLLCTVDTRWCCRSAQHACGHTHATALQSLA